MKNNYKKCSVKKKVLIGILIVLSICVIGGALFMNKMYKTNKLKGNIGIVRNPGPMDFKRGEIKELPKYDEKANRMWQVDLRGVDLSKLDVKDRLNDLMHAEFDSKTKWPSELPKEFDIEKIMELGKNPGLNIRKLHEKGITGKGVTIAIIDQMLLTTHEEYKDRLKFYEEFHSADEGGGTMHGSAVSSIAVGKTVGVAPEADLYYIAETHGSLGLSLPKDEGGFLKFKYDFKYLAKSIDRLIEINRTLPKEKKIRAISMAIGWSKGQKGYEEVDAAAKRAKAEGILVIPTNFSDYYDEVHICGLGRDTFKNPDNLNSYEPGIFWKDSFFNSQDKFNPNKTILVPMDKRCTAAPNGNSDYVFYTDGGLSWTVPYVSALYALCCQINPDITPEQFISDIIATGDIIKTEKNGKKYDLGKVANPEKLIEKVSKK